MKKTVSQILTADTRVEINMAFSHRRQYLIQSWREAQECDALEAQKIYIAHLQAMNDAQIVLVGESF